MVRIISIPSIIISAGVVCQTADCATQIRTALGGPWPDPRPVDPYWLRFPSACFALTRTASLNPATYCLPTTARGGSSDDVQAAPLRLQAQSRAAMAASGNRLRTYMFPATREIQIWSNSTINS